VAHFSERDVISASAIGEPDFVTPAPIVDAGIASLKAGHTSYTSNKRWSWSCASLSPASNLNKLTKSHDPVDEVLITVG